MLAAQCTFKRRQNVCYEPNIHMSFLHFAVVLNYKAFNLDFKLTLQLLNDRFFHPKYTPDIYKCSDFMANKYKCIHFQL